MSQHIIAILKYGGESDHAVSFSPKCQVLFGFIALEAERLKVRRALYVIPVLSF